MQIKIARKGNYFAPAEQADLDKLQELSEGDMQVATLTKPRNPMWHRQYFAIIRTVFENQEFFNELYDLRKFLEMAAGYYYKAYMPDRSTGEIKQLFWPQSIAYENMDQVEFQRLFGKVLKQVEANFGLDPEALAKESAKQ
jgi:hypothetical protein